MPNEKLPMEMSMKELGQAARTCEDPRWLGHIVSELIRRLGAALS